MNDAQWTDFDIPDGSAPVQMCVLRDEPDTRARTLFVSFPAGWVRSHTGSYPCDEELVVMDGSLELSGATYVRGDWALIPPGYERRDMATPHGALVRARFGGPARWLRGETPLRSGVRRRALDDARPLPQAPGSEAAEDVEVLSLDERTWWWVPKGEHLPVVSGVCFCRTFSSHEGGPS